MRFRGPKRLAMHTPHIHSADACFARSAERTRALTESGVSDVDFNLLRLKGNDDAARKANPFVCFCQELNKALKKPRYCKQNITSQSQTLGFTRIAQLSDMGQTESPATRWSGATNINVCGFRPSPGR